MIKGQAEKRRQADRRLLELFGRLDSARQEKLVAFAELLAADAPAADAEPVAVPRPADETVTAAIRRLVHAYPMLDRRKLMGDASRLMAQHALEGRAAASVIDDLEAAFAKQYEKAKVKNERQSRA